MDNNPNITMNNTSDAKINADDIAKFQNQLCFLTALSDCFKDNESRELDAFEKVEIKDGENANKLILDILYACFIVTSRLIGQDDMDIYDYINLITRLQAQKQVDAISKFRTPKEPYWRVEKDEDDYVCAAGYACPNCNMGVTTCHGQIREDFCSNCGQALDWNNIPKENDDTK